MKETINKIKNVKRLFPETKDLVDYNELKPLIEELENKFNNVGADSKTEKNDVENNDSPQQEPKSTTEESKPEEKTDTPEKGEGVVQGTDKAENEQNNKAIKNAKPENKGETEKDKAKYDYTISFEENGEVKERVKVTPYLYSVIFCMASKLQDK